MSTQTDSMTAELEATNFESPGDQHVVWPAVGWAGYETLLQIQGERSRPQILYLDGDVTLMSPSRTHERRNDRLGLLVREIFDALDIRCIATRETHFRRGRNEAGVQPDDSFYFQNAAAIAAKDEDADIDLLVDPPPDLVIEVVHKHEAVPAVEILRRFGVPEVWVSRQSRFTILLLGEDGQYHEADRSGVYPFLAATEIHEWTMRSDCRFSSEWIKALKRWIAEVIVPRVQPG